MSAQDAIADVLQENAGELTEAPGNHYVSEWLVLAMYIDEDGEASLVMQASHNQLRSHTLGLLAMAVEEM